MIGRLIYEPLREPPVQLYGREIGSHYQAQALKLSKRAEASCSNPRFGAFAILPSCNVIESVKGLSKAALRKSSVPSRNVLSAEDRRLGSFHYYQDATWLVDYTACLVCSSFEIQNMIGKAPVKQKLRALLLASASLILTIAAVNAAERWNTFSPPPPIPTADKSGYVSVNGIDMYYAIYGEGDPILLIHGGLGNGDIWAQQAMDLKGTRMVIVADSRGHGRSSFNGDALTYELMASDYAALLKSLNIHKVTVVGWSDGADIGLALAMFHPELVNGVFAHAPNVTTDGYLPGGSRSGAFQAYAARCASDYQRMSKTPGAYARLTGSLRSMWRSQPKWTGAQLSKITVPVWVVLGDHDEVIKSEHAKYILSVIPNSKSFTLQNTGHFSIVQDPVGYTNAILQFLKTFQKAPEQEKALSLQKEPRPAPQQERSGQEKMGAPAAEPGGQYIPNLERAKIDPKRAKDYLTASGYGRGEGKAVFFHRCGFKIEEVDRFIEALLAHARQNKASRIEETAHGTRYEIEGKFPCADGSEPALRAIWFIEGGVSAPRLLTATPQ